MPDGSNFQTTTTEDTAPEPKHFIRFNLVPTDSATEAFSEAFRREHGIRANEGSERAVWAFLAACKSLKDRDTKTFTWPSGKVPGGQHYQARLSVRNILIEARFFHQDGPTGNSINGRCTVYRLDRLPCTEGLRFMEVPPNRRDLVQVRDIKPSKHTQCLFYEPTGKMLTSGECIREFGEDTFEPLLTRMEEVNSLQYDHPLILNGDTYNHLVRKFSNRMLNHGGRLYGGYSSQKKGHRTQATIDGEPIVQLDVKASFLFIRAAKAGVNLGEGHGDPYAALPFVTTEDRATRAFAKDLVSAMISCGGIKHHIPKDIKDNPAYAHIIEGRTMEDFQPQILEQFPFLERHVDGLHVMYLESEAILKTLELAIEQDIPAWPLHDCIFVRRSDLEAGVSIIKEGFEQEFRFRPTISVDRLDGSQEYNL